MKRATPSRRSVLFSTTLLALFRRGMASAATPPGEVTSLSATGATASAINLSWAAGRGAVASAWTVTQRTPSGSGPYVAASGTFGAAGGRVTGLSSGALYDFQVVASNATGNSGAAALAAIGLPVSGPATLSAATWPNTARTGSAIQLTLKWTGTAPSGVTATWNRGGGVATIKGFTVTGPWLLFYATTPAAANTYDLTVTGGAATVVIADIVVSTAIADFAPGIHGPTKVSYGQQAYANIRIASYFARGLAGPAACYLSGPDSGRFYLDNAATGFGSGFGVWASLSAFKQPPAHFSLTVNITDGIATYSLDVTIHNAGGTTPIVTPSGNAVFDSAHVLNYWREITVARVPIWGASTLTFSDPSGLFTWRAGENVITIPPPALIPANFGVHVVTMTAAGGTAFEMPIYIGHEAPPTLAWRPNGTIHDTTPATNGYGSNSIGTLTASADTHTYTYAYTSNPTGKLNTYNAGSPYVDAGSTYLLGSVPAGTLSGVCKVTSTGALATSLVMALPVEPGTIVPPSNMQGTVTPGLTNFLPTANARQPTGSPATVLTLSVSGFSNRIDWGLARLEVRDDNCQLTQGLIFPAETYQPRYAITGNGTRATVTAWNLSAQTDRLEVTLTDGLGAFCTATFAITAKWIAGPAISVGPGGTFPTAIALQKAMWANPAAFAGARVTVLDGIAGHGDWSYGIATEYTNGWWPCPVHLIGDPAARSQVVLDFAFGVSGGSYQGGLMAAGGYDMIIERLEIRRVSNAYAHYTADAGAIYKVGKQPGNLTINQCYIHDSDNGFINGDYGNHIVISNNLFARCGNNYGSAHNVYVGPAASLTFTGNYSVDSWLGHELKTRAQRAVISGNWILEGNNCTASVPVDICDGGDIVLKNNVIMKQSDNAVSNNGGIVNWVSEIDVHPAWSVNRLIADGNTIVNNLPPGSRQPPRGYVQFICASDPVRNIPIVSSIANNGFYNLARPLWAIGVYGGTAPTLGAGNVALASYPAARLALIDPLTGAAPVNLPNQAMYSGNFQNIPVIASVPGTYFLTISCPSGSPPGTPLTGGLLAAYDGAKGQSLTRVTWSMAGTFNNGRFSLTPVADTVRIDTAAVLADGFYALGLRAVGTGANGPATISQVISIIVGSG